MALEPIQSSNLAAIDYNPDLQTLTVQFHNGSTYEYQNVEPETYEAMRANPDPGKYFAQIIKPQRLRYVYTRLS